MKIRHLGATTLVLLSCCARSASLFAQLSPLSARTERFVLEEAGIHVALAKIVQTTGGRRAQGVVIGLEDAEADTFGGKVTMNAEGETIADLLATICAQNGRYIYSEAAPGVVNVAPIRESPVLRSLLELPVDKVDIDVQEWPDNVVARLPRFVPQLGRYLVRKEREWAERHNLESQGSTGITMSTDVTRRV